MKTIKFRELRADEIDIRVGSTKKENPNDKFSKVVGFQLLLYKDARVDANVLDETVGAFNWQKKFYQVKNTMICSVGINVNYDDDTKEPLWVWKDDAGDESETEAIKGEASDSFKRASGGSCWGIGRALYGAPFVWLNADQDNDPKKSRYIVSDIAYSKGEITKLVICNEKTKQVVYSMGSTQKVSKTTQNDTENNEPIDKEDRDYLTQFVGSLSGTGYTGFFEWLEKQFGTRKIVDLTKAQGKKAVAILKKNK